MHELNKARAAQLLQSFIPEEDFIRKGEQNLDLLEKGGKKAVIGETRVFGGREYIKTATGWKFHGRGTGAAAQQHIVEAGLHHLNNAIAASQPVTPPPTPTEQISPEQTERDRVKKERVEAIAIAKKKSLENLKGEKAEVIKIKSKLDQLGFAKHHRNFAVLDQTFEKFESKGKEIINAATSKGFEFHFSFEASWYDNRTKASLRGLIGMNKYDLQRKYRDEWNAYHAQWKYETLDGWAAGKLANIIKGKPDEPSQGSSGYSYSGNYILNHLSGGELS